MREIQPDGDGQIRCIVCKASSAAPAKAEKVTDMLVVPGALLPSSFRLAGFADEHESTDKRGRHRIAGLCRRY
jgi:hypothetical protein